jgi:serine/threonine protein phosphatase PrpC
MGTTVAAVAFDLPHETAMICHVGHTRVYRLRENVLEQLTEDHTVGQQLVRAGLLSPQEWRTSRYRHVLTQAVGVGPKIHPTVRMETPQAGDLFLMCSDGVYRDLIDEEIRDLMRKVGTNLQQACDGLVELTNARGGRDDSTVVALRYCPASAHLEQRGTWLHNSGCHNCAPSFPRKSEDAHGLRHPQLGHPIEYRTLDPRFCALRLQTPCPQPPAE